MSKEIERKFLVRDTSYRQAAFAKSRIKQGYLSSAHGRTVRVRLRDDKAYLTIKGPSDASGVSRSEWEYEIPPTDAEAMLALCEPGMIDKERYLVRAGRHVFEVDEFHADNEGLTVAEVELSDPDEPYEHPSFLGEEVTGDVRYYNSYLTKSPYKTWK